MNAFSRLSLEITLKLGEPMNSRLSFYKDYALTISSVLMISFALGACSSSESSVASGSMKLDNFEKKFSYLVGYQVGRSISEQGLEPDLDVLNAAILDQLEGKESRLSQEEMGQVMAELSQKKAASEQAESSKNAKAAKEFLEKNIKKDSVKQLEEGLQYEVMTAGKGKKPKETDTVKVHYKGTLLDGSEFDSSYARNEPASFPLNRVIKGWTNALKEMPVGSKWKLFIHPDLAYGPRGRPGIPGNSLLVFEVELLEIES